MRLSRKYLAVTMICVAGVAIAAEATNPPVKARQELMDGNGANAKILGDMAKGETEFDAAKAAEAQAALSANAAGIADAFMAEETDPMSKAKPEIWTNWSDFEAKADALYQAAQALDTSSLDGVKAGMGAIGGACTACHQAYRS